MSDSCRPRTARRRARTRPPARRGRRWRRRFPARARASPPAWPRPPRHPLLVLAESLVHRRRGGARRHVERMPRAASSTENARVSTSMAAFVGGVRRSVGQADMPRDRRDEHDRGPLGQTRHRGLAEEEDRTDVDGVHAIEVVGLVLRKGCGSKIPAEGDQQGRPPGASTAASMRRSGAPSSSKSAATIAAHPPTPRSPERAPRGQTRGALASRIVTYPAPLVEARGGSGSPGFGPPARRTRGGRLRTSDNRPLDCPLRRPAPEPPRSRRVRSDRRRPAPWPEIPAPRDRGRKAAAQSVPLTRTTPAEGPAPDRAPAEPGDRGPLPRPRGRRSAGPRRDDVGRRLDRIRRSILDLPDRPLEPEDRLSHPLADLANLDPDPEPLPPEVRVADRPEAPEATS